MASGVAGADCSEEHMVTSNMHGLLLSLRTISMASATLTHMHIDAHAMCSNPNTVRSRRLL